MNGIDTLPLAHPALEPGDLAFVEAALQAPRRQGGAFVERLENDLAAWAGRRHGVAVASSTLGLWLALRALDIGPGSEVIVPPLAWHEAAHAVRLAGATPVVGEIDYWTGCLDPQRASARITPATRAILAGNVNGHPAAWQGLRELAGQQGLKLIEDSSEAIGSRYQGGLCGGFGDVSVLDFSAPGVVDAGGGAMLLTDDAALASELRYGRQRELADRHSVSVGARLPLQAALSDMTAALVLSQWQRLEQTLAQRKQVEAWYHDEMRSFEGIKPPYLAADVTEVHWMLYVVHLGTRFTASARKQMIDDLAACGIEAAAYAMPLHRQFVVNPQAATAPRLPLADRIGDRMLALPLHAEMTRDEVRFVVASLKDAATNVGAGAAIYL
jgi:perosamine synthetase